MFAYISVDEEDACVMCDTESQEGGCWVQQ